MYVNVAKILATTDDGDNLAWNLRNCHAQLNKAHAHMRYIEAQRMQMLGLAGELTMIKKHIAAENAYRMAQRRYRKAILQLAKQGKE